MRAKNAKRVIAGIGISAFILCGTARIASADPPPDKKQHQKHEPQKPKPAEQQKPPQPQAHQAQQPPPQHAVPQAQRAAQRPPEQARRQPPAPAPPRQQPPQQARRETPRAQPSQQPHNEQARHQPQSQRHAAPPVERAQPARASRHPQEVRGSAPQKQDVRGQPRPIPSTPARVSAPASRRVDSTVGRARLAPQQQQVLISQQQQRIGQYSSALSQGRRVAQEQTIDLQRQHRPAQYRFMQGYLSRLQQQEVALRDYRYYDYDNDPYFYTPADYRYYREDRYYETNEYGVALLRKALNNGYSEGWQAGTADREDGWRPSYGSCYAYHDANYGYTGYYLDRATYNYYFREGFRRGYDDGYYGRYRYGRYSNGARLLQAPVVSVVLRIEHLG